MDCSTPACCSYSSTPSTFKVTVPLKLSGTYKRCTRPLKGSAVLCSSSRRFNPPGGDRGGGQGRGGLILPGRGGDQQNGQSNQLIMPGGRGNGGGNQPGRGGNTVGGGLIGVENKPALNPYRPPPGFMDDEAAKDSGSAVPEVQDPQVLLNRMRSGAGQWHELAELVPALAKLGIDNTIIEAETGIERAQLNAWLVSVQVYESLKRSGELTPAQLAYFDREDGAELLYEMRLLSTNRPPTAAYIADNELDPPMATLVARSVKEQQRRKGENEGFSDAPGDCLAYKYYRDAMEAKKEDAKLSYVEKGLEVAVTDAARAKLRTVMAPKEEAAPEAAQSGARLEVMRLTREEMAFQPVPLLPNLPRLSAAALAAAPRLRQSGPFSAFTVPPSVADQQWVALPAWNLIRLAQRPVAITIEDCMQVPAIVAAANPRSDEAKLRLRGAGLLIVDASPKKVSDDVYYVVENAKGGLEIVEGSKLDGVTPCAQVLVCCRPPSMNFSSVATETASLLQV
ncbi:Rubisco accumulation factor 1, chloroplastic [Coccomyxa sp. Obi]|nr:Rubisco accumulation factor 1, chloroplastic [Coccomyxa sp. Obi]